MQRATSAPVITTVIHAPSRNFRAVDTMRIVTEIVSPAPLTAKRRPHVGSVFRTCHQCTHIPSWESVNVRKTLIEYMRTRTWIEPRAYTSIATAAAPMRMTPFCVTSRSERRLNRCGTQESIAMFARTRGPARKLDCAATKRRSPSETRRRRTNAAETPPAPNSSRERIW
jgi:hypothetical protein